MDQNQPQQNENGPLNLDLGTRALLAVSLLFYMAAFALAAIPGGLILYIYFKARLGW